jgi:hypothetical protein
MILPDELLIHIFTYVSYVNKPQEATPRHYKLLIPILLVDRNWYHVATQTTIGKNRLYHSLCLYQVNDDSILKLLSSQGHMYFERCQSLVIDRNISTTSNSAKLTQSTLHRLFSLLTNLRHLEFRFIQSHSTFVADDFVIALVSVKTICHSLEHLTLLMTDVKDCHVHALCSHLTSLKELNVWGNWSLTEESLEHALKLNNNLESLEIGGYGIAMNATAFQKHISRFTRLKKLNVSRCSSIETYNLDTLPVSLESLNIGFCHKILDCEVITSRLQNLKQLYMFRVGGKSFSNSLHKLSVLTQLEILNLQDTNLSDDCMIAIQSLANLRELNIQNCSDITSNSMARVFSQCIHLTKLNLIDCSHIDDSVLKVLSSLRLESLFITCPKVTDDGLIAGVCQSLWKHTLKSLYIYSPKRISNTGLKSILRTLNLTDFIFSHCNQELVDESALEQLSYYQKRLVQLNLTSFPPIRFESIVQYIAPLLSLRILHLYGAVDNDSFNQSNAVYYTSRSDTIKEIIPREINNEYIQQKIMRLMPQLDTITV